MKKSMIFVAVLSTAALLGSGCVSLEEYNRVAKHLETEQQANTAISAEAQRLEGEVVRLRGDNDSLRRSIDEMKELHASSGQLDRESLMDAIRREWGGNMSGSDWEFVRSGSAVGVRLDDSGVLFRSGSWELTDQTKGTLKRLADVIKGKLNEDATRMVRVDGHTDNDPIRRLAAQGIKDNVHLSTMRAMSVRDYLVTCGIPKDRVFVAGFGEFWPINTGNSARDKQRNRRVEVYLGTADALSIGSLPGQPVVSSR
jgi:chemotaxis protein MotB